MTKLLYRTYDYKQARAKQIERETATGLKWDFYHIGDGYVITAIATKDTLLDEDAAKRLLPWLDGEYRNFHVLADRSGMSLADVVSGAKTLAQTQRGVPTVNRNGNFYGIRK